MATYCAWGKLQSVFVIRWRMCLDKHERKGGGALMYLHCLVDNLYRGEDVVWVVHNILFARQDTLDAFGDNVRKMS